MTTPTNEGQRVPRPARGRASLISARSGLRIALLLALTIASGCTGQQSVNPELAPTVTAGWLPTADGPPVTSMDAATEGILRIDITNKCVTLDDGTNAVLLVFQDNARLDVTDPDDPILIVGEARFRDGDTVSVGGGGWRQADLATASDPAYENVSIPATCAEYSLFIVAPNSTR